MTETMRVQPAVGQYAARIGIDWADKKHNWSLQENGKTRVERGELKNTPEAIDVFATELAQRFPGEQIAVALA